MAASGIASATDEWMQREPFLAWLASSSHPGGRDQEPGTVLMWRDNSGVPIHAAITIGDGWAFQKASGAWWTPRSSCRWTRSSGRTAPPDYGSNGTTSAKTAAMPPSNDVWDVLATARTIRRFTDEPVDDATLAALPRSGVVGAQRGERAGVAVRRAALAGSAAVVADVARKALVEVIEPVYGMSRPADDDHSRYARNNRATYELHDRAGERTSVLFCTVQATRRPRSCCSAGRSIRRCRTSSSRRAP